MINHGTNNSLSWSHCRQAKLPQLIEELEEISKVHGFASALEENTICEGEDVVAYIERVIREFKEKNSGMVGER